MGGADTPETGEVDETPKTAGILLPAVSMDRGIQLPASEEETELQPAAAPSLLASADVQRLDVFGHRLQVIGTNHRPGCHQG